jgi:hypothetical protein
MIVVQILALAAAYLVIVYVALVIAKRLKNTKQGQY